MKTLTTLTYDSTKTDYGCGRRGGNEDYAIFRKKLMIRSKTLERKHYKIMLFA